jgi:DNA-binding protein HU-beta
MAAKAKAKKAPAKVGKPGSYPHGKAHFVDIVMAQTGATKKVATATVDDIIGAIIGTVKKAEVLKVPGLGIFKLRKRPARKGRNPFTGEMTTFKASKKISFRAAKQFKDAV